MEWFTNDLAFYVPLTWLIIMVFFVVLEAISMDLTVIWFALGSLVALVIALIFPEAYYVQIIVMLLVSAICLLFIRRIAKAKLGVAKYNTNADSFIGKQGIVTQSIKEFDFGEVKVNGVLWTATFADGESKEQITEGSVVEIVKIAGAKLYVKLIKRYEEMN